MKDFLHMVGKLIEAFGGMTGALGRIASSLEGCHYELRRIPYRLLKEDRKRERLLQMVGKLIEAFGGMTGALGRIASSLEGCHYELREMNKTLDSANRTGWGDA